MKEASRAYSKAYNDAYNRSLAGISPRRADREANDARWELAAVRANEYLVARDEYKEAKRLAKENLKKFGNRKVDYTFEGDTKRGGIQEVLGLSNKDADKVKKIAKIAGISLATTGGILAVSSLINNYYNDIPEIETINLDDLDIRNRISLDIAAEERANLGQAAEERANLGQALNGVNSDRNIKYPLELSDRRLFNNKANGDYVGFAARLDGFHEISSDSLKKAILERGSNQESSSDMRYKDLIKKVRVKYCSGYLDALGSRRLSCWSASNAFFMSAMTGKEFISKSFTNLVDFNDFGKLYTKAPEIFDAFGNKAENYVGKFGVRSSPRASANTARSLVENIFKNVNSSNNVSADGTRTVGFVNAAYRRMTCTHQWNFEIAYEFDGRKTLVMSDGWSGERHAIAKLLTDGTLQYFDGGFNMFAMELNQYNEDSIRFYAPSVESIDTDMMSKVILGK
jgi:hypothetical protein